MFHRSPPVTPAAKVSIFCSSPSGKRDLRNTCTKPPTYSFRLANRLTKNRQDRASFAPAVPCWVSMGLQPSETHPISDNRCATLGQLGPRWNCTSVQCRQKSLGFWPINQSLGRFVANSGHLAPTVERDSGKRTGGAGQTRQASNPDSRPDLQTGVAYHGTCAPCQSKNWPVCAGVSWFNTVNRCSAATEVGIAAWPPR